MLNNLVNKNSREFYFSIIFGNNLDNNVFKHEIKIKFINNKPYIAYEKMSILKGLTINGDFINIYQVEDGELTIYDNTDEFINNILKEKSLNILTKTPFVLRALNGLNKILKESNNTLKTKDRGILTSIFDHFVFIHSVTIYLNVEDKHNEFDEGYYEKLIRTLGRRKELLSKSFDLCVDVILKKDVEEYLLQIKKLTSFIKIFKPNIIAINVETKEEGDYIHCTKVFVYDGYKVAADYESTGIKKLMEIFSSIDDIAKGSIVFIDELDANISGVYLDKLIEYLNQLNKGQLCFTTHNTEPMKYLYNFTNSIDFIGETGKVITWVKNGNYRPYNLYSEGMIEDLPFNIDSFDFMNVFEAKGDN